MEPLGGWPGGPKELTQSSRQRENSIKPGKPLPSPQCPLPAGCQVIVSSSHPTVEVTVGAS